MPDKPALQDCLFSHDLWPSSNLRISRPNSQKFAEFGHLEPFGTLLTGGSCLQGLLQWLSMVDIFLFHRLLRCNPKAYQGACILNWSRLQGWTTEHPQKTSKNNDDDVSERKVWRLLQRKRAGHLEKQHPRIGALQARVGVCTANWTGVWIRGCGLVWHRRA